MSGLLRSATTLVPPTLSRATLLFVTAYHYQPVWGPHQTRQLKRLRRMPHTRQKAKKSASGTMRDAAKGGVNAFSRMSAGTQAARVCTLAKSVPNDLELQRALTPLRHSQFERELVNHPDKAWTHWLLSGIKNGVALGYDGPRGLREAWNLTSASQHAHVIDEELRKECLAGRILGPFPARPIKNLKCSGLGAVPKKGGKWRMILHLSAPPGQSINDYISKEEFSLRYSSIGDATRMLSALGKGSLMHRLQLFQNYFRDHVAANGCHTPFN